MKYLNILLLFVTLNTVAQQGGMWIPSLLEGMNEDEMTRHTNHLLKANNLIPILRAENKTHTKHIREVNKVLETVTRYDSNGLVYVIYNKQTNKEIWRKDFEEYHNN